MSTKSVTKVPLLYSNRIRIGLTEPFMEDDPKVIMKEFIETADLTFYEDENMVEPTVTDEILQWGKEELKVGANRIESQETVNSESEPIMGKKLILDIDCIDFILDDDSPVSYILSCMEINMLSLLRHIYPPGPLNLLMFPGEDLVRNKNPPTMLTKCDCNLQSLFVSALHTPPLSSQLKNQSRFLNIHVISPHSTFSSPNISLQLNRLANMVTAVSDNGIPLGPGDFSKYYENADVPYWLNRTHKNTPRNPWGLTNRSFDDPSMPIGPNDKYFSICDSIDERLFSKVLVGKIWKYPILLDDSTVMVKRPKDIFDIGHVRATTLRTTSQSQACEDISIDDISPVQRQRDITKLMYNPLMYIEICNLSLNASWIPILSDYQPNSTRIKMRLEKICGGTYYNKSIAASFSINGLHLNVAHDMKSEIYETVDSWKSRLSSHSSGHTAIRASVKFDKRIQLNAKHSIFFLLEHSLSAIESWGVSYVNYNFTRAIVERLILSIPESAPIIPLCIKSLNSKLSFQIIEGIFISFSKRNVPLLTFVIPVIKINLILKYFIDSSDQINVSSDDDQSHIRISDDPKFSTSDLLFDVDFKFVLPRGVLTFYGHPPGLEDAQLAARKRVCKILKTADKKVSNLNRKIQKQSLKIPRKATGATQSNIAPERLSLQVKSVMNSFKAKLMNLPPTVLKLTANNNEVSNSPRVFSSKHPYRTNSVDFIAGHSLCLPVTVDIKLLSNIDKISESATCKKQDPNNRSLLRRASLPGPNTQFVDHKRLNSLKPRSLVANDLLEDDLTLNCNPDHIYLIIQVLGLPHSMIEADKSPIDLTKYTEIARQIVDNCNVSLSIQLRNLNLNFGTIWLCLGYLTVTNHQLERLRLSIDDLELGFEVPESRQAQSVPNGYRRWIFYTGVLVPSPPRSFQQVIVPFAKISNVTASVTVDVTLLTTWLSISSKSNISNQNQPIICIKAACQLTGVRIHWSNVLFCSVVHACDFMNFTAQTLVAYLGRFPNKKTESPTLYNRVNRKLSGIIESLQFVFIFSCEDCQVNVHYIEHVTAPMAPEIRNRRRSSTRRMSLKPLPSPVVEEITSEWKRLLQSDHEASVTILTLLLSDVIDDIDNRRVGVTEDILENCSIVKDPQLSFHLCNIYQSPFFPAPGWHTRIPNLPSNYCVSLLLVENESTPGGIKRSSITRGGASFSCTDSVGWKRLSRFNYQSKNSWCTRTSQCLSHHRGNQLVFCAQNVAFELNADVLIGFTQDDEVNNNTSPLAIRIEEDSPSYIVGNASDDSDTSDSSRYDENERTIKHFKTLVPNIPIIEPENVFYSPKCAQSANSSANSPISVAVKLKLLFDCGLTKGLVCNVDLTGIKWYNQTSNPHKDSGNPPDDASISEILILSQITNSLEAVLPECKAVNKCLIPTLFLRSDARQLQMLLRIVRKVILYRQAASMKPPGVVGGAGGGGAPILEGTARNDIAGDADCVKPTSSSRKFEDGDSGGDSDDGVEVITKNKRKLIYMLNELVETANQAKKQMDPHTTLYCRRPSGLNDFLLENEKGSMEEPNRFDNSQQWVMAKKRVYRLFVEVLLSQLSVTLLANDGSPFLRLSLVDVSGLADVLVDEASSDFELDIREIYVQEEEKGVSRSVLQPAEGGDIISGSTKVVSLRGRERYVTVSGKSWQVIESLDLHTGALVVDLTETLVKQIVDFMFPPSEGGNEGIDTIAESTTVQASASSSSNQLFWRYLRIAPLHAHINFRGKVNLTDLSLRLEKFEKRRKLLTAKEMVNRFVWHLAHQAAAPAINNKFLHLFKPKRRQRIEGSQTNDMLRSPGIKAAVIAKTETDKRALLWGTKNR
eukprot:GHVL01036124.1.p1 GENE.GHVL01036124.1~~GHVL01036124.1.p1  ORF type:complete len:2009 (-),score=343.77 GHVL01036124.1:304-5817(-)